MIAKNDFITSEKMALEGDIHDLLAQKEELDLKIEKLYLRFLSKKRTIVPPSFPTFEISRKSLQC